MKLYCLATVLLLACSTSAKRFDGFKLISVQAKTTEQVERLRALETLPDVTFWKEPNTHLPTDISVPPGLYQNVTNAITEIGLVPKINIEDLQSLIDAEKKQNSFAKLSSSSFRSPLAGLARVKGYFLRFDEVNQWLEELESQFPNVQVSSIGRTYQGRDTKVLRIGSGRKPAIFIDSGIHAREWISVSTSLYMIYEIVAGSARDLLDNYDFYFVPVANPDGYEYTHTKNRMWRKNRRPMYYCVGADPNRNFDINFGGVGTSGNPCTDIYRGPSAFSEPCAANLARFLINLVNKQKVKAYMSLHAYSQMWFTPYAYNKWTKPRDYAELTRVAELGAQAIYNTHGRRYTVGSPGEILYEAAGSSMDWVKARLNIKYSFAMEMRPDMYTNNGFIVPPSEIIPGGEEMLAGIRTMVEEMQ